MCAFARATLAYNGPFAGPKGLPPEQSMPLRLSTSDASFASHFDAFLATKREASEDVDQSVRAIIADVRARGDRR